MTDPAAPACVPTRGRRTWSPRAASDRRPVASRCRRRVDASELSYESGVELKARSQWAYARIRFFRHRLAVVSLFVLIGFGLVGASSRSSIAPYGFDELDLNNLDRHRRDAHGGWHSFGTDQLGRDYLSRVIYGIRTSLWVALIVAHPLDDHRHDSRRDRRLLRRQDRQPADALHRPHPHAPGLAVLLTAAAFFGQGAIGLNLGVTNVTIAAADGDRPHPRVPLLDGARAHRARHSSSRCARRSSSRRRRRPARATCGSSRATSSRTASGRSSSA